MDVAFVLAVMAILAFAFTNGFNDAANAIATLVASRGARPGMAIIMAAICNMLGPLLLGAAVANTIGSIAEVEPAQTAVVVGAALTAVVLWNVTTWRLGLPSSSSHALVGGLVGATVVEAGAGRDGPSATEAADAAVKTQRQLERVYRKAASALLAVDDLREVVGRRELYRRLSRISEILVQAADRVWYATVKEG